MRNNIMKYIVVFVFLNVSVFISGGLTELWASPVRGPFPTDITVRDDVEVQLRFPYEVLLANEQITGYLAIRNLSDEPLTVLSQEPYRVGDQILFDFRSSPDSSFVSDAPYWPKWDLAISRNPIRHLSANEYVWYDIDRLPYEVSMAPPKTQVARAGVVTGPDEWAFSEWMPIRRIDDRIEDGEVLLEFVLERGGFPPLQETVRVCTIEGEEFIFYERDRIARVPEGATPRAVWDNETGHLTINFDGVDVPAAVFRITDPVKWTPETVPHMQVLKELKAELENPRNTDPTTPDPDPVTDSPSNDIQPALEKAEDSATPAPPPQSSEAASLEPEAEPSPARRIWPTLLVLLLIAGGTVLVIKHKRQG